MRRIVLALTLVFPLLAYSQQSTTRQLTLEVLPITVPLKITTASLPNAFFGLPYSETVLAEGGQPPYTWSLSSGPLPAGITLDAATGTLFGIPTELGMFPIELTVTDFSSPPSPPPPNAVLDDFERAGLGSNWTVLSGNVGIVNNSDLGLHSKSGLGIVVWNATTFSADQFSEVVISLDIHPDLFQQVFIRRRVSDSQRYGFHWQVGKADCDGGWVLKRDGGVAAPVLNCVLAPKPAPGDTMRIEVQGSNLRGFHNRVLVITAIDSVLIEPGQPGIAINAGLGNIPPEDFPVSASESWSGGEL